MPLAQLPPSTIKLIGSSQVITSVSSVIKELLENSIDAGANLIEIKLDKHGLEKIEIKDDGHGISKSDATVVCLPSYTSKISHFSDLDRLSSYGFRGEALSALCNVAQVSLTTKSGDDDIANCYTYDLNGQVICSKISHIQKGTIVTVTGLFKNLPVRKQFMSNAKRAAEELKKVEKVVKSLAMVHPRLRVTLIHNKFLIWQKTSVPNLRQSVMQVMSVGVVKQLHHVLHITEQVRVEMLVPKQDCEVSLLCFSNFADAYFLFINNRPVRNKEVEKAVYNKLFNYFGVYVPVNKYPVCVTCLTLPADCIDVNLEPNKTRIYFKNQDEVLDIINQCLHLYYGEENKETEEKSTSLKSNKKRKVEDDAVNNVLHKVVVKPDRNVISQGTTENTSESQTSSTVSDGNLLSQEESDSIFEKFCIEREKQIKDKTELSTPLDRSAEQNNKGGKIVNSVSDPVLSTPSDSSAEQNNKGGKIVNNVNGPVISSFFSLSKSSPTVESLDNRNNLNGFQFQEDNILKRKNEQHLKDESEDVVEIGLIEKQEIESTETRECEFKSIERKKPSLNFVINKEVAKNNIDSCQDDDQNDIMINCDKKKPVLNQKNDAECFGMTSPTLSQWSRGEVKSSSGNLVKGSHVLLNSPAAASSQDSQPVSERSVSSQMGCKEMSAFTKFARNMRKQILEENPNMSFTRVAQLLQMKWRQLNLDEKKKYEEVTTNRKVQNTSPDRKQQHISSFTTVVLEKRANIELEVHMDSLKQMVKSPLIEKKKLRVIGRIEASPLWLYHSIHTGISVVCSRRLCEAIKFHKYLANYTLPSRLLDQHITIYPRELDPLERKFLLSLERSPNGVLTDTRIVSNGFLVEIVEGSDEEEARLIYVPQNISYCGAEELREVLMLMQTNGLNASLSQCRPLKIISFIRSEVMREVSREELPSEPHKILDLLSYWLDHVAPHSSTCIHHLPIVRNVHCNN